jgi:hypothetical protein
MILEEQLGHTQFKFMVTMGSFLMYHASGFLFLTATKFPKNIFQTKDSNTI